MNISRIIFLSVILLLFSPNLFPGTGDQTEISLPDKIGEWKQTADTEVYEGEDLFLYINGGADIYHEYGFVKVTSAEYSKEGAGRISVELYRMADPVSAFGIFSFRTGGIWRKTSDGNLTRSDGYYLNLLAGTHLITVTSIDINDKTAEGIRVIRKFLGNKISSPPVIPNIINRINGDKYPHRSLRY